MHRAIAGELSVAERQVVAAIELLDGGATVPFIARYRKEATGGLDDAQLRTLTERLTYLREFEERRNAIIESIRSQGKLTDALAAQIMGAQTKARLEDIYLPYKPKRRTRAQIAREAGLEPLAELLLNDPAKNPHTTAMGFVDVKRGVSDIAAALDGAQAILIERFSEDADLIGVLRERTWSRGKLAASVKDGKEEAGAKFSDYFDFNEPYPKLPSHRILAMFRGEKEGFLDLTMDPGEGELVGSGFTDSEALVADHFKVADRGRPADRWLSDTVRVAWRARISVHIAADLRMRLWHAAEDEAVRVFAANLRDLLLAAPAGARTTMGLDPGFRTGVKVTVVDKTGKPVATKVIYPHEPQRKWDESIATLAKLAAEHNVDLIAIGNGTASRETDKLAADLIKAKPDLKLTKVMVSEAGASVYSASAYASRELPEMDVSLRGAVSIARRLQDPLAELVKIDPKSIGVGQYQHDLTQGKLSKSLDAVVETCVNAVGVDVNTASVPLLTRVSGISEGLAGAIVAHRDERGPFSTRQALKEVPRLGPKAFEQCAGFLRITGGDDPLDSSAVHPEAYPVVRRILEAVETRGRPRSPRWQHPGERADRQHRDAAVAEAGRLHRRAVRPADRHRHPGRAGKARPGPAPRVHHGGLRRGRRVAGRPEAGHGARRRGHQCGRVRRVRRYRRPPGRAGARLGDVAGLRQRPARGRQAGRHRQGQGARRGHSAQADLADLRLDEPGATSGGRSAESRPRSERQPADSDRRQRDDRGGQRGNKGSGGRTNSGRQGSNRQPEPDGPMAAALRRAGLAGPAGPVDQGKRDRKK